MSRTATLRRGGLGLATACPKFVPSWVGAPRLGQFLRTQGWDARPRRGLRQVVATDCARGYGFRPRTSAFQRLGLRSRRLFAPTRLRPVLRAELVLRSSVPRPAAADQPDDETGCYSASFTSVPFQPGNQVQTTTQPTYGVNVDLRRLLPCACRQP